MPNTTSYSFADVVLVPFPFTDQATTKKRPDIILMAITSRFRPADTIGEVALHHWRHAGLLKPSVLKPLLATIERSLIIRAMGALHDDDRAALRRALSEIIG